MRIESVRALKAELAATVVAPVVAASAARFSVRARSLSATTGVKRTVALGIAPGAGGEYRLAVRLQRRTLEEAPELAARIADHARGEADIRYIGRVLALDGAPWHQRRQRPLLIGASVAHKRVTAGTIGGFPLHRASGRHVILSNNHVLGDQDRGLQGDAVLQPGPFDGGLEDADRIGALLDRVPLRATGNRADAAIATIDDVAFDPETITGWDRRLDGTRAAPLDPGERVVKVGRTTGLTFGTVTAIELDDVVVDFDRGALSFDDQVEIEGADAEAFSAGGDSGSLILDMQGRAAALLFAGGDQGGTNGKGLTYANPISAVLDALDLVI